MSLISMHQHKNLKDKQVNNINNKNITMATKNCILDRKVVFHKKINESELYRSQWNIISSDS